MLINLHPSYPAVRGNYLPVCRGKAGPSCRGKRMRGFPSLRSLWTTIKKAFQGLILRLHCQRWLKIRFVLWKQYSLQTNSEVSSHHFSASKMPENQALKTLKSMQFSVLILEHIQNTATKSLS